MIEGGFAIVVEAPTRPVKVIELSSGIDKVRSLSPSKVDSKVISPSVVEERVESAVRITESL